MIYGGFIPIIIYQTSAIGGGSSLRTPLLTEDSQDIDLENGTDYIEAEVESP